MRAADRDDHVEDLYLAIRTLMEHHGVPAREIRRLSNLAIKGEVPAAIRDRLALSES